MIYCFDLDGTICQTPAGDYHASTPIVKHIQKVNQLYNAGHKIIIETARGSVTGLDWTELTQKQLLTWGVKYHQLRCGVKFHADYYIDDKSINSNMFF